jgi:hypothetical protein
MDGGSGCRICLEATWFAFAQNELVLFMHALFIISLRRRMKKFDPPAITEVARAIGLISSSKYSVFSGLRQKRLGLSPIHQHTTRAVLFG